MDPNWHSAQGSGTPKWHSDQGNGTPNWHSDQGSESSLLCFTLCVYVCAVHRSLFSRLLGVICRLW